MDLVLAQLPLLLFTAIVPMAAGAFVGLSNAFLTVDFTPDALRRIDRWTLLPVVILAVGLAAGLVFFVSPQMSLVVAQGIDAGALTFVGALSVVFALAAVVYWMAAMMGALSYSLRKAIVAFMSVLAIAYAVSIGVAYFTSAVSTWASLMVPIGFAGFCIAGGVPLGTLVIAAAGALPETKNTRFAWFTLLVAFIGALVGIVAVSAQLLNAQAAAGALLTDTEFLPGAWVYLAVALAGFVVSLACLRGSLTIDRQAAPMGRTAGIATAMPQYGMTGARDRADASVRTAVPWLVASNAAVLLALIVARIMFYALQL